MECSGASLNSHVSPPPYGGRGGSGYRGGGYRGAPTELQPLLEGPGGAQDNGAIGITEDEWGSGAQDNGASRPARARKMSDAIWIERIDERVAQTPGGSGAKQGRASGWSARNNLTKAFLGAASFELPWALQQSGLGAGVLSLVLFALACAYTLKLLGRTRTLVMRSAEWISRATPTNNVITYVEIGRAAYGSAGARLVNFGVVGMSLGVCAAYLVFVGTTLHSVFVNVGVYPAMSIGGSCASATSMAPGCIALPLLVTLPVFGAIALLEDYSKLAWTSLAGIVLVVVAMASVLIYGAATQPVSLAAIAAAPFIRWRTYPLFFGNAAFTFCIHTVAIPVHASLADPERDYEAAVDRSTMFVAVINIAFAAVCSMLFQSAGVQANVLQNLPQGEHLSVLVKVLLCVVMILTYALFLQPVAELIEHVFFKATFEVATEKAALRHRRAIRVAVILVTTLLALAVPDFGLACNLVGSVANTLVGLIMPPLFYRKLMGDRLTNRERTICATIVVFGTVLMVVGTTVTVIAIVDLYR